MTTTVNGIEELKGLVAETIGPSEWREVTQDLIDRFAEVSGDDQWIHVDTDRAKTESPFGTTVAHGNLTLSMIDGFRSGLMESSGFQMGVNYGWNKVRFPAPVAAGSRIRASSRCFRSKKSAGVCTRWSSAGPWRSKQTRIRPAWRSRSPAPPRRWPQAPARRAGAHRSASPRRS